MTGIGQQNKADADADAEGSIVPCSAPAIVGALTHAPSASGQRAQDRTGTISLRDLHKMGLPVPPGFEVTGAAFREFMETRRMNEIAEGVLAAAVGSGHKGLEKAEEQVRRVMAERHNTGAAPGAYPCGV